MFATTDIELSVPDKLLSFLRGRKRVVDSLLGVLKELLDSQHSAKRIILCLISLCIICRE